MYNNSNSKHSPIAEINVIPYIDVMLVLVVIFMVVAQIVPSAKNNEKLKHFEAEMQKQARTIKELLEQKNMADTLIKNQVKHIEEIKNELTTTQKSLSESKGKIVELESVAERLISQATPRSVKMCNERNYEMEMALTYYRKSGVISASMYSEGWYHIAPHQCKTVQLIDAVRNDIMFYEKNRSLAHASGLCMNRADSFHFYKSDDSSSCSAEMIPTKHMVTNCIMGDGTARFVE